MDDIAITRIMPNSLEAEQSVNGSMLMDKQAIISAGEILSADDFYHRQYGIMFQAMVDMNNAAKPVDIVTLQEALKEKDVPPEVYSLEFIRELLAAVPTSANIRHYATIVKDKAILRNIIRVNDSIATACYEGKESTEDILADTEKRIFELVKNKGGHEYMPIDKVVLEALDKISIAAKNRGAVTGVPTGFIDLDNMLTGLHGSELILVAARPAMGKTAFVLNIAHHVAVKKRIPVAIFSLEMSKEQLVTRMIALDSLVNSQKIQTGQLVDDEWDKIMESTEVIADAPIFVDDNSAITVADLRSKCRKLKQNNDLGLIIIDYLQLMSTNKHVESRQQFISDTSRALKVLARELNVPVIALSQLNRAVDSRPDHKPVLADLRESGAIEQDSDVVMFIYRDDYYNPDTEKKGIAEIIIAKQRKGATGSVDLVWMQDYTKFANKERPQM